MNRKITTIFYFFILIVSVIGLICARSEDFEQRLKKADSLWKANQLSNAIKEYKKIIVDGEVPVEYQSLIGLRLAKAQYQAKQITACKQTISSLKLLPEVREHHLLELAALENKINNLPITTHTEIPKISTSIATYYVSGISKDNDGNGSMEKPFLTIENALKAVKTFTAQSNLGEGSLEIVLLEPHYDLSHTINVGNEYSGTKRNPIIIRSLSPIKRTLISGGVSILKWNKESDPTIVSLLPTNSRLHVLVADLKENGVIGIDNLVFGGAGSKRTFGRSVPQFFYKGTLEKMARWPNDRDTIISLKKFTDKRAENWSKERDIWLQGYWGYLWANAYEKFKFYANDSIILETPVNSFGFKISKWHVLNSLSEMDRKGDWKISPQMGKIWFFPPEDFIPESCILSVNGPAFIFTKCDYITFKDIDFRHLRGDAIQFNKCNNINVINCTIKDVSGSGIIIAGGNNHIIHTCTIQDMGRGGIQISSGDIEHLENSGSLIENCTFKHISLIDHTYTPAIQLGGDGIKVQNCLFENMPSSAMRLDGNDMLVQLNEFAECVFESDDQGAIDEWGNPLYRGNVVRWNYFHDIGSSGLHGAGIRLDDEISGYCISENIFSRSSNGLFGGVQIHGGQHNIVEGNLFTNESAAISQTAWGKERWTNKLKDIKTNYWQNALWQSRYPDLKHLQDDFDKNYFTDNIAINVENMYLRKSNQVQLLNESQITDKNVPDALSALKKYIVPWHLIPIEEIGIYENK